jgi:hypothetical protein
MARDGKCPCLSQTDDSIVYCQKEPEHEGLHEWRDPVHPGHSKLWAGTVTEPVWDTRFRYESPKAMAQRLGLVRTEAGGVGYAPMMDSARVLEEDQRAVELVSGESK